MREIVSNKIPITPGISEIKYALKGVRPDSPSISGSLLKTQYETVTMLTVINGQAIIIKIVVNLFMLIFNIQITLSPFSLRKC